LPKNYEKLIKSAGKEFLTINSNTKEIQLTSKKAYLISIHDVDWAKIG
jgi:hypothetical protein